MFAIHDYMTCMNLTDECQSRFSQFRMLLGLSVILQVESEVEMGVGNTAVTGVRLGRFPMIFAAKV